MTTTRRAPAARGQHKTSRNGQAHGVQPQDTAPASIPGAAEGDGPHLTDLGNGRRLIRRHGQDLRHCHPWRKWLAWDGRRWEEDAVATAKRHAKDTIVELFATAATEVNTIAKHLKEQAKDEDTRTA